MQKSRSTANHYARTSDSQRLLSSAVITSLVLTLPTYPEINAGVKKPKNHVLDQTLLTLLGIIAGLHHLMKNIKESRKSINQG